MAFNSSLVETDLLASNLRRLNAQNWDVKSSEKPVKHFSFMKFSSCNPTAWPRMALFSTPLTRRNGYHAGRCETALTDDMRVQWAT